LITAIQSPLPETYSFFGISVDVFGDIVSVGNFKADLEDTVDAGKAHLFDPYGDHLLTLLSPDPGEKLRFGHRVAVGDEIILVSQLRGEIQGVLNAGCVYVYDSEGVHLTTLLSPSMKVNACFGNSVDASDEFILIGEVGDLRRQLMVGPGSVYVFDYSGNLVTTLAAPEPEDQACFGCSVFISNDRIVVGEFRATVDGYGRAGRAYIFDTDWNLLQTLRAPSVEENAEFGCAVAICGDIVVVGEYQGDVDGLNEGKAYVFDLDGTLLAALKAPTPGINAQFGYSVATDGEIVAVGEPSVEVDGESSAGKVYVFAPGPGAEPEAEQEPVSVQEEAKPEAEEDKPGFVIPGFPHASITLGLVIGAFVLWLIQRKQ